MSKRHKHSDIPRYRGRRWIEPALPQLAGPWLSGRGASRGTDRSNHAAFSKELKKSLSHGDWKWPKRPLCFISDLHADSEAFWASLVASGGVRKTGPADRDFRLTRFGREARFMIGGDCFDKGPSTLRLLDNVRRLAKSGADLEILAGNHDIRMMLGILSAGRKRDPRTEHFFVRMGPKVVPFLKEIQERYLDGTQSLKDIPGTAECRRRLFPGKRWFDEFPLLAGWVMPDEGIEREMKRLRAKMDRFEDDCAAAGLSLRMVYAAAREWQRQFQHPKGEYAWFFRRMTLARRIGSFLFIHAGLDDRSARIVHDQGVKQLNRLFRDQIRRDPFDFYYGPIANTIRTKYRTVDRPLTRHGVELIRNSGIQAVVHGHRNLLAGQRIMLRKGMIHFECDCSLDRSTRKKEGLTGHGAAATLFHPRGRVLGISSDYPGVKVFDPKNPAG
jgi:hypothetical protein